LNGKPIPRSFLGDHLKPFKLRFRHLITGSEKRLPIYQNIRFQRYTSHLPKYAGGTTVYSTCTAEENNTNTKIEDFLDILKTAIRW
ncbi:hypothetical protein OnM2_007018, partial [Erysiphe neolycopersici]